MPGPLDLIPLPVLFAATLAVVLLSIEGGLRLGRRRRSASDDEKEAPVGAIVAASLGLLGFVLAFTYGMAASRFDARRKIIVDEANSIGTTYLRAGLLEDSRRRRVRTLLREYVEERLSVVETGDVEHVLEESSEVHRALWMEAEAAGREQPESVATGLFIQALNDTIDIHSSRVLISLQSRIPPILWATLLIVTMLSMFGVGYLGGLSRSRRSPVIGVLALSFSALLYVVADLDRPREGLIDVSQGAMRDVRQMMNDTP
jgi:hypothetical protein